MTVTRTRWTPSSTETDRYGVPVQIATTSAHEAWGFAPSVTAEIEDVERVVANFGGTLYFRAPAFCDARPSDRFMVRGVEYRAEGPEADWWHSDGSHIGTVIVVKRSEVSSG